MRRIWLAAGLLVMMIAPAPAEDPAWSEAANEQPHGVETAAARINVGDRVLDYAIMPTGEAVVEGDMGIGNGLDLLRAGSLPSVQSVSGTSLQGLFRIGNYLWPKGIVLYVIDPGLPNPGRVRDAIKMWEAATDIRFQEVPATSRVYVKFVRAESVVVCQALGVGYSGGRQIVQLGDTCTTGNVAHEIGHVLGHTHEQMRSDRDRYVTVHMENVQEHAEGNFVPKPAVYANIGPYCYDSIFHYGEDAFAKAPGLKTIVAPAGIKIGQRQKLAACDIATTQEKYKAEFAKR